MSSYIELIKELERLLNSHKKSLIRSKTIYRERLHPKNVVVTRNKCRIRNRPNSGHKFK